MSDMWGFPLPFWLRWRCMIALERAWSQLPAEVRVFDVRHKIPVHLYTVWCIPAGLHASKHPPVLWARHTAAFWYYLWLCKELQLAPCIWSSHLDHVWRVWERMDSPNLAALQTQGIGRRTHYKTAKHTKCSKEHLQQIRALADTHPSTPVVAQLLTWLNEVTAA